MAIAHKYGDHVDTDVIIPARYLASQDEKELASHCMEDIDKDFHAKIKPDDLIVAGLNFGCGSSREHAPVAIKASGISCVIAKSFARIFYRNAINIGLAILECPEAAEDISDGDEVSVNFDTGLITNDTKHKTYKAEPFPEFIKKIIQDGGLMASLEGDVYKKLMKKFRVMINTNDQELAQELISDNAVFQSLTSPELLRGGAGYLSVVELMRKSFSDIHWEIEDIITGEKKAAVSWICSGTHDGDFMGMPPTQKKFSFRCMNFYYFNDDNKIINDVAAQGMLGLFEALGLTSKKEVAVIPGDGIGSKS